MRTPRDSNQVPTMLGASDADGITLIAVRAHPTLHYIDASDGSSGADSGRNPAVRDENSVSVLMAVSNGDGITPVEIYIDHSTNKLLIKST